MSTITQVDNVFFNQASNFPFAYPHHQLEKKIVVYFVTVENLFDMVWKMPSNLKQNVQNHVSNTILSILWNEEAHAVAPVCLITTPGIWMVFALLPFLIHFSIIWIFVMSCLCPASCLAKTLTLDIMRKLFNQWVVFVQRLAWQKLWHWTLCANCSTKFFHTCHVICTIDFCHFIPLLVTLMLTGSHKVSRKSYWFHFLPHFSSDQSEI